MNKRGVMSRQLGGNAGVVMNSQCLTSRSHCYGSLGDPQPPKVLQIGLPSTLLLEIRSKIGAARRTTFDPVSKKTTCDSAYIQVAIFGLVYAATYHSLIRAISGL